MRMDHHCPWIRNCIGIQNQKYFLLFSFYLALICFYFLTVFTKCLIQCYSYNYCSEPLAQKVGLSILTGIMTFTCLVFTCFSVCLIKDQVEFIKKGISTIDRKFKKIGEKQECSTLAEKLMPLS